MEILQTLLNDHQTGMSKFQDNYFVTVRAGGTLYGQYKQSLRELYKRFRGLRQLTSDNKRLLIDIDEAKYKSENETDEFARRRAEVDYQEKSLLLEESERSISDTKREFINFYKQAVYLKSQIGELTEEVRDKLDREMWEFKIKEMACIDFITTGRLRNSTFEFINACPREMKLSISNSIKDHNNLISWYENKEEYHIPDALPDVDIPNLDQLEVIE